MTEYLWVERSVTIVRAIGGVYLRVIDKPVRPVPAEVRSAAHGTLG